MNSHDVTSYDYTAKLELEHGQNIWRRNRTKIDFVLSRVKKHLREGYTVAEIGVGEGYLIRKLCKSGMHVVGVELSEYLVRTLKRRLIEEGTKNFEIIAADASEVDLGEDRFDLLFALDVLEHIPGAGLQQAMSMSMIKKSLRDGGLLITAVPIGENLANSMVMCPKCGFKFHIWGHHHSFDSFRDFRKVLGPNFKIIQCGTVGSTNIVENIFLMGYRAATRLIFNRRPMTTIYCVSRLSRKGR